MNEAIDPDVRALIERGERIVKIQQAGPTARELVDAFEEESLYVEVGGVQHPAYVGADGIPVTASDPPLRGPWGFRIARPDFSPARNLLRRQLFMSMCERKTRLQTEDLERRHDTTDHVLWKDRDGEQRAAPAENADAVIEKAGIEPGSHPKVWRPS